jgi:hypothetical protein
VVQRLMLGGNVEGSGMRRQRLDTFALNRQHQPTAIFQQALMSCRIVQTFAQMRHIPIELIYSGHESSPTVMKIQAS